MNYGDFIYVDDDMLKDLDSWRLVLLGQMTPGAKPYTTYGIINQGTTYITNAATVENLIKEIKVKGRTQYYSTGWHIFSRYEFIRYATEFETKQLLVGLCVR